MADAKVELTLELACCTQVDAICNLVNLCYRGERGWTTEKSLVSGDRLDSKEVQGYLYSSNTQLLVAIYQSNLVACICIEKDRKNNDSVQIGLFAVHPDLQGQGVGKDILLQAEQFAAKKLNITKYIMHVLTDRQELIEFYQRRGYIRTGVIHGFPIERNVGVPIEPDLMIEILEKVLN